MGPFVRVSFLMVLLVGCGQTTPVQAPPPPLSTPEAGGIPLTVEEALATRQVDRDEQLELGLRDLSRSEDPTIRKRSLAILGSFLLERRRFKDAEDVLTRAISEYPALRPLLQLRLAEAQAGAERYSEAAETVSALLNADASSSFAQTARIRYPSYLARAGRPAETLAALSTLHSVPADELSEKEFMSTAEGLESAGRPDLAGAVRFQLLTRYPQTRFAEEVYRTLTQMPDEVSPLSALSFAEALDLADRLGRANRYDQTLDLLRRIELRFPDQKEDASFRYARAKSNFNSRNYAASAAETVKPGQPLFLQTELLRARALWREDRNKEFLEVAGRILRTAPRSSEATSARLLLAKYYITDEIDYQKAASLLERAITDGAAGTEGENLWILGWTYTLAGKDDLALRTFERYLKVYPDHDYTTNALFWTGKIHQRNGRTHERDTAYRRLVDSFPYAYYSYRARALAGWPLAAPTEVENGIVFPDLGDEAWNTDPRFETVRELQAIGEPAFATQELKRIASSQPEDRALSFRLAELYASVGEYLKANGILQRRFRDVIRHGGKNVPPRFWEILYPRPYWESIQEAAKARGLSPYRITSIIRQESGFDPSVVSSAGAVGLMQIMPVEAERIATDGGLGRPVTREDLFDPTLNIAVGAAEFVQKRSIMNGNELLAIASYNAGESAVGRWTERIPLDDIDFFIESIPFNETRLYVKNVTRNEYEYRRIYDNS